MNKSRTEKSIRNLLFAWGGQGIGLLMSMVTRAVFVRCMAVEYLGLTGLFSNILSMLSLVELGIGPAMTYSLYKPLVIDDREKIKSLMRLYRLLYVGVGISIFILGLIMLPIYRYLIKDVPDILNLDLIFFLYVANTGISYFFSYRRSLIEADQNRYIITSFLYIFMVLMNFVQIVELVIFHDYAGYMVIQVCFTWIENFCIAIYAGKKYPYLKEKHVQKLQTEDLLEIKRNIGAMVFHKVGSVVVLSTDNILVSRMLGLENAGLYANYSLLTRTLNNVLYQAFNSIVASVGNLRVKSDKEEVYKVFKVVFFFDFWIYGFVSIALYVLVNPVIKLWLGETYVLDMFVVATLVIRFYLYGMLKAVRTFRDAAGLYYQDRFKPFFEVTINLIASILLVRYIGMAGIFLGTIISTLMTCFWIEPWILFKNCFFVKGLVEYFQDWLKYMLYTVLAGYVTEFICNLISKEGIIELILQMMVCVFVPNVIFFVLSFKTDEMHFFIKLLQRVTLKWREKKINI